MWGRYSDECGYIIRRETQPTAASGRQYAVLHLIGSQLLDSAPHRRSASLFANMRLQSQAVAFAARYSECFNRLTKFVTGQVRRPVDAKLRLEPFSGSIPRSAVNLQAAVSIRCRRHPHWHRCKLISEPFCVAVEQRDGPDILARPPALSRRHAAPGPALPRMQ